MIRAIRPNCRVAIAALALLSVATAQAMDIRHWKRKPIDITLPVGIERIVVFGRDVRVGLPPVLASPGALRVQSTSGAVYLLAKKPFESQRVQVQNIHTGEIILLDLAAQKRASHETIRIKTQTEAGVQSASKQAAPARLQVPSAAFGRARAAPPTPVRLVRHAAQALYAPMRLVDSSAPGIFRVALSTPENLPGLLPSLPVNVRPLAAWRCAPYTVTAIEITNRDPQRSFHLDPRALAGVFYAASFMHSVIGPAGALTDTTTLFVVTKSGGLASAMAPPSGDMALAAGEDDAD